MMITHGIEKLSCGSSRHTMKGRVKIQSKNIFLELRLRPWQMKSTLGKTD